MSWTFFGRSPAISPPARILSATAVLTDSEICASFFSMVFRNLTVSFSRSLAFAAGFFFPFAFLAEGDFFFSFTAFLAILGFLRFRRLSKQSWRDLEAGCAT
ncbi:hypothetical protein [uncultured Roseibium sp.]|uniref:hypothetical protein n=1 Tax=uncultured Roseibium sp. TaxID=1936171 RepID=UPI0032170853